MKNISQLNIIFILSLLTGLSACSEEAAKSSSSSPATSSPSVDVGAPESAIDVGGISVGVAKGDSGSISGADLPTVGSTPAMPTPPVSGTPDDIIVPGEPPIMPEPEQPEAAAGIITAGEWHDLSNWDFWKTVSAKEGFAKYSQNWGFHTNNRVSVLLTHDGKAISNEKVELLRNDSVIWTAKTDNLGSAELWVSLFQEETDVDYSNLKIQVNGVVLNEDSSLTTDINEFELDLDKQESNKVDISFIVDATGSMSDEINFLKRDLESVINQVKEESSNLDINTSTVFYRDEGDEYVTKVSEFNSDLTKTIDFIKEQHANGGGDYPEAVHSALDESINNLTWNDDAKTKIAFLLLDAPAHETDAVKESLHNSIKTASAKGIKIIPIVASGIDKNTEFMMRNMAISTNGTYVFITNDSGVGNNHIEASVGKYNVENLNYLMVRLIKKYSE